LDVDEFGLGLTVDTKLPLQPQAFFPPFPPSHVTIHPAEHRVPESSDPPSRALFVPTSPNQLNTSISAPRSPNKQCHHHRQARDGTWLVLNISFSFPRPLHEMKLANLMGRMAQSQGDVVGYEAASKLSF